MRALVFLVVFVGACAAENAGLSGPVPYGLTTFEVGAWHGDRGQSVDAISLWCPHAACEGLSTGSVVEAVPAPGALAIITRVVDMAAPSPKAIP